MAMAKWLADKWAAVLVVQRLAQLMGLQAQGPRPADLAEALLGALALPTRQCPDGEPVQGLQVQVVECRIDPRGPDPRTESRRHKDGPSVSQTGREASPRRARRVPQGDEAHVQVEGLRDLLRGRAPAQSFWQKLKSVLDKLGYQRTRSKTLKQKFEALEEEKLKIEKDIAEADTLTKSLEEEKASLCFIVGPETQAETSEEEEDAEDEVLNEEQTAAMMKRLNPSYLSRMLQAEIEKQRAADRAGRDLGAGPEVADEGMGSL